MAPFRSGNIYTIVAPEGEFLTQAAGPEVHLEPQELRDPTQQWRAEIKDNLVSFRSVSNDKVLKSSNGSVEASGDNPFDDQACVMSLRAPGRKFLGVKNGDGWDIVGQNPGSNQLSVGGQDPLPFNFKLV